MASQRSGTRRTATVPSTERPKTPVLFQTCPTCAVGIPPGLILGQDRLSATPSRLPEHGLQCGRDYDSGPRLLLLPLPPALPSLSCQLQTVSPFFVVSRRLPTQ